MIKEIKTKYDIKQKVYAVDNSIKGDCKVIRDKVRWFEYSWDGESETLYYHLDMLGGCFTEEVLFLNEAEAQEFAKKVNSGEVFY